MRMTSGKRKSKDAELGPTSATKVETTSAAMSEGLAEALKAAGANPGDEDAWQRAEEATGSEEGAATLIQRYRGLLDADLPAPVREMLAQRAFRFAADCFGENAPAVTELLEQILAVLPQAEWAFGHLGAALTMNARWSELLDIHDKRLGATTDPARRRVLLGEAAHIAKDLAGDQVRAAGYLAQLFDLDPTDAQAAAALERLFERQERWADLADLWKRRLAILPAAAARDLRRRIAVTLYEKLGAADAALAEIRALLPDQAADGSHPLTELLERMLRDERVSAASRLQALDLLRTDLESSGAGKRLTVLLPIAIEFARGEALQALRRECGERLQAQGDSAGALEQYAALICLCPQDLPTEARLRQLAEAAGNQPRLAEALRAAADACPVGDRRAELLARAAEVHRQLGSRVEAAALFEQAVSIDTAAPAQRLENLRRLDELYGDLGNKPRRLHTLERLATVEPGLAEQRMVWARAAAGATDLGETDRALAAWEARLLDDPRDAEALAAVAQLLESAERWQDLIEHLERRIGTAPPAHQIRTDLVQIATVARDRLADLPRAISAWRQVGDRFGEDVETVDALADLYAAARQFQELADLLARNAGQDRDRHAGMLVRLGDTRREQLRQAEPAIEAYTKALEIDPAHAEGRAGLLALLSDPACAVRAAAPLARAAERTDSWQLLLDLLPHRVAGEADPARRVRLFEEAALMAEGRAGDAARALPWLCQALPLAPGDLHLCRELLRLARATGTLGAAAQALGEAIATGQAAPLVLAQLGEERARLLEEAVPADLAAACDSYAAALALCPQRRELREGLVRTAGQLGRWNDAAAALIDPAVPAELRDTTLLPLFEEIAVVADASAAAIRALGTAVEHDSKLAPLARRDLEIAVAQLFLERGADPAAADAALGRALALDPRHVPALLLRAEVQRRRPDRALYLTLVQLGTERPENLDFLREAAELASGKLDDDTLAIAVLGRLCDEAERLLRLGTTATGTLDAKTAAQYALDRMVARHVAAGTAERSRRAIALLTAGAQLDGAAFGAAERQAWLRRAAELTETALGDRAAAIELWRHLHEQAPDEAEPREALCRLLEQEERFGEAIWVRAAELARSRDAGRRLAMRLEIVRLCGLLDAKVSPADVLRANLGERPGHTASLRELTTVLTRQGRPSELGELLEQQARLLEQQGETSGAAAVWAQLAQLAEKPLGELGRATSSWQRVAELEPTTVALDALARLTLATADAGAAAAWLERRLAMTSGEARTEVTVRLAHAYLGAGQRHRAIACLDRTLGEFPAAEPLRAILVDLYRSAEAWEPLARVLAEGCEYLRDEAAWAERARAAVELYGRLGLLGRAVPLLEKLVRLAPADDSFRSALADGLNQCGRRDEARTLLLALIEEAGWRRSRKRASLHHRLSEVARGAGDLPFALEHLELASSMDVASREILQQLAEVAAALGADDRAERAYRALLVLRRQDGAESTTATAAGLAPTEILLRLHDLSRKRGQDAEADELMESALTAATVDAAEAQRLQSALLQREDPALLDRLFDKRLAHAAGPAAAADVHAERAACRRAQGRGADALAAQIRALEAAPARTELLAVALELARAEDEVALLVDRIIAVGEGLSRKPDAPVRGALLLQAAQLCESDLGDLDRALSLCREAEKTHAQSLEIWDTLARIASKRGDVAECDRLIGLLKQSATEAGSPAAAADALYRAAALELPRPETRAAGIVSLCEAVEKGRDLERALDLVNAVGLPQEDLVKVLPLYERMARQSGDERMLLDYLERRCATPTVTVAEAREAVDLAVALGRSERVEPLLLRLADVASLQPEADKEATWALLELVQRKKAAGDLEAAAVALDRVADRLDAERVSSLTRELGERAARTGNTRLGADLLEKLRARTPGEESIWRPLLDRYVELADADRLEQLVSETLPLLVDPHKRNQLRLARAQVLLARDAQDPAALECLRDVLLDEPDNTEAPPLLAAYYERTGADGELVDLLEQRFEQAAAAKDADAVSAIALRLGEVLERNDGGRATELYERALHIVPGQRDLLRRLLARTASDAITPEQATLMEELLDAGAGVETPRLALELADIWSRLEDEQGVRRVLEKAWAIAPDAGVAARLEQWYRAHEAWAPLADLLAGQAGRRKNADEAVVLLRQAAALRSTRLGDADGAVALLMKARERAPEDMAVVEELVRALVKEGDTGAALGELQQALDNPGLEAAPRLALLLLRAEIEGERGDRRAAVAALQQAYAVDPEAVFEPLSVALSAWRDEAAERADTAGLRDATLALATLLRERNAIGEARELLEPLMHTRAADARMVRLAADLAEAAGDIEAAFGAAAKLVTLTSEPAERITAAEQVAVLAERLGRPADAAASLEAALAANPGHPRIIKLLVELHERTEERRKLALLLLDQSQHSADEGERFERVSRAGALFVDLGEGASAVKALNDALALRPNDQNTTLLLSDAYVIAGALQEAAALLKPLIGAHKGKASPALSALYAQLARIAVQAGDVKTELQALSRALDADRKNGVLAAQLADRAEALGDDELLVKALRMITVHPGTGPISVAVALLRQAKLAQRQGDSNRAILFARQASQEAAEDEPTLAASREFLKSVGAV
jgi:tetratricopeptide (TPR) repeat protein